MSSLQRRSSRSSDTERAFDHDSQLDDVRRTALLISYFEYYVQSPYTCDTCGKHYKWRESLSLHKRMECGIEPRFPCNFCGRKFKHKHHLTKHQRSIHLYDSSSNA